MYRVPFTVWLYTPVGILDKQNSGRFILIWEGIVYKDIHIGIPNISDEIIQKDMLVWLQIWEMKTLDCAEYLLSHHYLNSWIKTSPNQSQKYNYLLSEDYTDINLSKVHTGTGQNDKL